MDIRTGIDKPYYKINREERFFCATLYSLLVQNNDNIKAFIRFLNEQSGDITKINEGKIEEFELYLEYAYLRDIWFDMNPDDNVKKHDFIFKSLQLSNKKLESLSTYELNNMLVGRGKPSESYIQNPGTWSISKFARLFPHHPQSNEDFEKICKYKWCFNIKPDLVIQINHDRILSIEAKLESGEGSYPSSEVHIKEFNRRGLKPVKQTELQKFMFEKLLDMKVDIFFLVKSESERREGDYTQITWCDVFSKLDFRGMHPFVLKALKENKHLGWS